MPYTASTTGPAAVTVAVAALLIALGVLAGIREEERHMSLTSAPRTRIAAITRHLTGAGVRNPHAGPRTRQGPDSTEAI
jgi:hypothetical protein